MWKIRRPSEAYIERFLNEQRLLSVSYQTGTLAGFKVDHERIPVGTGEATFQAGCRALREWRMFPGPWVHVVPPQPPLEVGQVVSVVARVFGVWWSNACRIVTVIDETAPTRRFGFTYATLPGHVELGEETFLIEMDETGGVWYSIRAVSRPNYWGTKLGYPLARWMQQRFRRDSQRAMQDAIRLE